MKNLILIATLILCSFSLFSQEVCLYENFYVRINHQDDVPTIQTNQIDGTVKLIHKEKYITDIFAKYKIYGFEKPLPSAQSENLQKTYFILRSSKDLVKELSEKVTDEVF